MSTWCRRWPLWSTTWPNWWRTPASLSRSWTRVSTSPSLATTYCGKSCSISLILLWVSFSLLALLFAFAGRRLFYRRGGSSTAAVTENLCSLRQKSQRLVLAAFCPLLLLFTPFGQAFPGENTPPRCVCKLLKSTLSGCRIQICLLLSTCKENVLLSQSVPKNTTEIKWEYIANT